jgi:hypothetical protein
VRIRLIRTELLALRSVRSTFAVLAALAALSFLAVVSAMHNAGRTAPALSTQAGLHGVLGAPLEPVMLFALVLGALAITGEYRHHTATQVFLDNPAAGTDRQCQARRARPRRLRLGHRRRYSGSGRQNVTNRGWPTVTGRACNRLRAAPWAPHSRTSRSKIRLICVADCASELPVSGRVDAIGAAQLHRRSTPTLTYWPIR